MRFEKSVAGSMRKNGRCGEWMLGGKRKWDDAAREGVGRDR
jgi:hypothetical protein